MKQLVKVFIFRVTYSKERGMAQKTILILGGYGLAGQAIARLLYQWTDTRLILAGRHGYKAVECAAELNAQYPDIRASGIQVDASHTAALRKELDGVDLLVVASSTARYAREVARAAFEAGVDYLDIQYSTEKLQVLGALAEEIHTAGRCFITDGGFHPGLPAALVRYAAGHCDRLERAVVGCALRIDWSAIRVGDSTTEEFVAEMRDYQSLLYRGKQWRKASYWRRRDFLRLDFGEPLGRMTTVPMMLEEMRVLPEMVPGLQETGFYISGLNWFVDYLVFPLGLITVRVFPRSLRPVARMLFWGLRTFSHPPYGIVLQLEADGEKEGMPWFQRMRLSHTDGYFLTAAPTVACIRQYLEGSARSPGLHFMAHIVDPSRLMTDLGAMGVDIQEEPTR
jgi:hypothetical protein